ncbi:hypothetical protein ACS0TY_029478 [Phlomoides rotata]
MANNSYVAVLPISNAQLTAAGENQTLLPSSTSNSVVRAFFTGISETVRSGLANRRPWQELVDRSAFSKPESLSEATVSDPPHRPPRRLDITLPLPAII